MQQEQNIRSRDVEEYSLIHLCLQFGDIPLPNYGCCTHSETFSASAPTSISLRATW
jgi:hypothetical protein